MSPKFRKVHDAYLAESQKFFVNEYIHYMTSKIKQHRDSAFRKNGLAAILIFIFASFYVWIPYEALRGGKEFRDYQNYVDTFSKESFVLKKSGDSIKGYISNEILWDFTVRSGMSLLSAGPSNVLSIVSFIVIASMAAYVRRGAGWFWILLLFNPLVIDFVMSQCRMAFGMSLFYGSLLTKRKKILIFAMVASIFVHTAMIPITAFYWIGWWMFRGAGMGRRPIIAVFCLIGVGVLVALLIGPFQSIIRILIEDDRRYGEVTERSSFVYSLFWMMLLPLFAFLNPSANRIANNAFVTVILSVFVTSVIFQFYGIRFIAASFPSIICAVSSLNPPIRNYVLGSLITFTGVQWIYWT